VCTLGFKIVKKRRSNIKRIPRRCLVFHFKDYNALRICNEGKRKDSYENCNKIDESHDLTKSLSDFVIPDNISGNIINLDSSALADEVFSEFFDMGSTSSETSDNGENNKCFELHDSIESIADMVIPGDIPDIESLMLENFVSMSNFFMDM